MKFYLSNVKSLILRYAEIPNNVYETTCSREYELIFHNDVKKLKLIYSRDDTEMITWLLSKEISFDRSQVHSNKTYKFNIELYGCYVEITEDDEEFLLYKKLKGLIS